MTKDQQIEFIRSKCIEANPSIKDVAVGWQTSVHSNRLAIIGREIRLADVLLTIKTKDKRLENAFEINHKGIKPVKYNFFYQFMMVITKYDMDGGEFWKFSQDSLSSQSPDTLDFIFNLLQ